MRIPLPQVVQTSKEVQAHPFPAQISFQTLELMQASVFHTIVADEAAGQRVRQPNGVHKIDEALLKAGLDKTTLDDGWKYLNKYMAILERSVTQNVLIALRSHWDWYIRNLGYFVAASIRAENSRLLSKDRIRELEGIGFKDVTTQLSIIKKCAGVEIHISKAVEAAVYEMSLVRNLGLHNRWEVDEHYIQKTKTVGWSKRDIRHFKITELEEWHEALMQLVNVTWSPIAKRFKNAPAYNIES